MTSTNYRPEIDGLRAVAVAAVVLFHAGLGVPGGYVGVDVFFVISGFLITGIIVRGLEDSSFSLTDFWERRVRRIFPALIVMVVATLGLGYRLLLPHELAELGKSSVAQALLLANVYFWRDVGYFAGPAELKPLLHTWSLAVEEQFYLVFPLLLVFFKSQGRQRLFWGMVCGVIISFAASVYGVFSHPSAAFFLLPTRVWELLIGCMLSVLPWKCYSKPRLDEAIAIAGLLAILLPALYYDSKTPFPGLAAIPPVVGTAAVIYATTVTQKTMVGRFLSLRPIVFVGLISYSLYLWHWPVIAYVRMSWGHFGWKQAALALACSITLSVVSSKFVETPFRHRALLQNRRRLFAAAFLTSGATILLSIIFVATGGVASRFPANLQTLIEDTAWTGDDEISVDDVRVEKSPTAGTETSVRHDGRIDFLLWGDSHGQVLNPMISEIAAELGLTGRAFLHGGQVPLPGVYRREGFGEFDQYHFKSQIMEYLKTVPPRNLILVGRWSWHTDGYTDLELSDNSTFRKTAHLLSASPDASASGQQNADLLLHGLEILVPFCEENGVMLWIVKQVPESGENQPARNFFQWSIGRRLHLSDNRLSIEQHIVRQAQPERIFQSISSSSVRLIDPAPYLFSSDGLTINFQEGRSLYRDEDHLTRWGVERLRELLKSMLLEMKRQ